MDRAAPLIDQCDIIVDDVFPHSPDVLWKTLTTPKLMARWLMDPSGFVPVVGNRFSYQTTPAGAWDGRIECEVLEVTPHRRLAYSWKGGHEANLGYGSRLDTVVTFVLEPSEAGTRVRITHSGFTLPRNASAFENLGEGWPKVLEGIGRIAGET